MTEVDISADFRKRAFKSIFAVFVFFVIYLFFAALLFSLSLGSICGGIFMIINMPSFFTIMLGAGLVAMGAMFGMFLLRFIFSPSEDTTDGMTQVYEKDQAELFAFVKEISDEVGTEFPKKIFISPEVNAAVFYDSAFRSMIFPTRKNLNLGIALINSVTVEELRAIIAHEMGHFSQRSMKIGSYVYNLNKVVYNLLYDDETMNKMAYNITSKVGFLSLFVGFALGIVSGMRWTMAKIYEFVNISYMALSREMEFHADSIAAKVAGSKAVGDSLLRIELSQSALSNVLNYYNGKMEERIQTRNLYPQHKYVMRYLGERSNLKFVADLPMVTLDEHSQFNKSKLELKDQWASHPSTEERIARLAVVNNKGKDRPIRLASELLRNSDAIESQLTTDLFTSVKLTGKAIYEGNDEFIVNYDIAVEKSTFDLLFNHYYSNKNPVIFSPSDLKIASHTESIFDDLFGEKKIDLIYSSLSFENDSQILKAIEDGNANLATFDYDGIKYKKKKAGEIRKSIQSNLKDYALRVAENDKAIQCYFNKLAEQFELSTEMQKLQHSFQVCDESFEKDIAIIQKIADKMGMVGELETIEEANRHFKKLAVFEKQFKEQIKEIQKDPKHLPDIPPDFMHIWTKYVGKAQVYFDDGEFNDEAIGLLSQSLNIFGAAKHNIYFRKKKELLDFMASLERRARM